MIDLDMSAGDPSDTIPPPIGEDDAYSATTKVGAMPAELMAKLRAEGLLPSEAEERRVPRPGKGGEKPTDKATTLRALEAAKAVDGSTPPPSLISRPPGKDDETLLRPEVEVPQAGRLPSLVPSRDEDEDAVGDDALLDVNDGSDVDDGPVLEVNGVESAFPPPENGRSERPVVETPVAFASPNGLASPVGSIPAPASAASSAAAVAAPKKGGRVFALLAVLALVAIAVVMALSGRGR